MLNNKSIQIDVTIYILPFAHTECYNCEVIALHSKPHISQQLIFRQLIHRINLKRQEYYSAFVHIAKTALYLPAFQPLTNRLSRPPRARELKPIMSESVEAVFGSRPPRARELKLLLGQLCRQTARRAPRGRVN